MQVPDTPLTEQDPKPPLGEEEGGEDGGEEGDRDEDPPSMT